MEAGRQWLVFGVKRRKHCNAEFVSSLAGSCLLKVFRMPLNVG